MNKTFTEWQVASTTSSNPVIVNNFVRTTDTSLAELAMRQVNKYFGSLGADEEELMQRFEQERGIVFERFYGSVDAGRS